MADKSTKLKIDEALFNAWKNGEEAAKNQIWAELWKALHRVAFGYCRGFCRNDADAEDMAQAAIIKTYKYLESLNIEWRGTDSFVSLSLKCLRNACNWELNGFWERANLETPIEGIAAAEGAEEAINLLDYLGFAAESPEDTMLRDRMKVEGVRETLRMLAAAREACLRADGSERVLAVMVEMIEAYVRRRLVRASGNVKSVKKLTTDKLLIHADLDDLDFEKKRMNRLLMKSLRINRGTLDQRMRNLRALLKKLREGEKKRLGEPLL